MAYKFSPSSLSLLKDCPRCFWLNFNKNIKRPDSIFPSLPSGMDKVLKEHFDRFMKKGELPPELLSLNSLHLFADSEALLKIWKKHFEERYGKDFEKKQCQCNIMTEQLPPELQKLVEKIKLFDDEELLKVWRSNFKGISWTDKKGNLFHGAIDNLLKKSKKLIVLDYKTRGFPLKEDTHEHYQDQMDIYNFLLRKNGYETEDYTYLLFYYPHQVEENGHVCFNTDLVKIKVNIKNAESIFKKAVEVLEAEIPAPSEECGFCKWVYINNEV